MTSQNTLEEDINCLQKYVETFSNFPIPGINSKDVLSLFNYGDGIKLLDKILNQIAIQFYGKIDCIVMIESRGFLIAPMIALHLRVPCIPVGKKGSLPGPVVDLSYALEYGEDTMEMQINSVKNVQKILLVDNYLATGGTLKAASKLIKIGGGNVVQGLVLMEKLELEGRKKLNFPILSIISY